MKKEKLKAVAARAYVAFLVVLVLFCAVESFSGIEWRAKRKALLMSVLESPDTKDEPNEYDRLITHAMARQELSSLEVVDWSDISKNMLLPIGLIAFWHVGEWILFGATSLRPYRITSPSSPEHKF